MLITLQHCTKQTTTRNKNTNRTTTKKDSKHFRLACLHDSVKRRARGTKKKEKMFGSKLVVTRETAKCASPPLSQACAHVIHAQLVSATEKESPFYFLPASLSAVHTPLSRTQKERGKKEKKEQWTLARVAAPTV